MLICIDSAHVVISQDSRTEPSDNTLIYADIGPNIVNRVKKVAVVPDDGQYRVQYAEINYKAKAPQNLCVPPAPEVNEAQLNSGIIPFNMHNNVCSMCRNN